MMRLPTLFAAALALAAPAGAAKAQASPAPASAVDELEACFSGDTMVFYWDNGREACLRAAAARPDAKSESGPKALWELMDQGRFEAGAFLSLVYNDPKAEEALVKALSDDHYRLTRDGAAFALGMLKDPASAEPLRQALRAAKDDPYFQVSAARALCKVSPDSDAALALLRRIRDEKDPRFKDADVPPGLLAERALKDLQEDLAHEPQDKRP